MFTKTAESAPIVIDIGDSQPSFTTPAQFVPVVDQTKNYRHHA